MTLFFHILDSPHDEKAESDLELIGSVSYIIQCMPIHKGTSHAPSYIKNLEEFVVELYRLGKCAVMLEQN